MNITYRAGAPLVICQRSFAFTDKEANLLRLALDCAASEGEIQNCSIALIRSLRKRYKSGHQFLNDITQPPAPPPPSAQPYNPYSDVRMTFGKHRGKRLRDIDPAYMLWVLDNCRDINPYLRNAIRRYLA